MELLDHVFPDKLGGRIDLTLRNHFIDKAANNGGLVLREPASPFTWLESDLCSVDLEPEAASILLPKKVGGPGTRRGVPETRHMQAARKRPLDECAA
jgi:hypothetical protein